MNQAKVSFAIRGNVVYATHNPFVVDHAHVNEVNGDDQRWLGPGIRLCVDHVISVNTDGIIVDFKPAKNFPWDTLDPNVEIQSLGPHSFLIPGMIDLHIHAPQFAYTGTATDRPLMGPDGWLETYTFPAEAGLFHNSELCQQVYRGVVRTTLYVNFSLSS